MQDLDEWNYETDNVYKKTYLFEVFGTPVLNVLSKNSNELLYFIQREDKSIAKKDLKDWFDHILSKGECYVKGKLLQRVHLKSIWRMQFKIIPEPVYVTPDETNRAFFEVAGKLSLKDFNITITNFVTEVHQFFIINQ